MKKFFVFAAAMAVALSSCSKNEVVEIPDSAKNAIGFGTYVGSATKATSETGFEAGDVFVIDAYYTADKAMASASPVAFMQNQKVTGSISAGTLVNTWTYSPIKYWPNNDGDKISFFAATNATNASPIGDFDALSGVKPSFTVTDASSDIMVASALDVTKQDAAVNFVFQHTMSQVNFTAKLAEALAEVANTKVKITELSVDYGTTGTNGGTFTYNVEDIATNGLGSWAPTSGSAVRTADTWNTDTEFGIGTDLDATATPTIGEPIMVIPNSAAKYTVSVKYTVATTDSSSTANNSTITNICKFEIHPTDMNTQYTYKLAIDLTEVKVSGKIAEWTDATQKPVDVTIDSSTETVTE